MYVSLAGGIRSIWRMLKGGVRMWTAGLSLSSVGGYKWWQLLFFGVSLGHLVGMVVCLLSLTSNFEVVRSTPYCEHTTLGHGGPL